MRRRRPICQIPHSKVLATNSAHTENVKASIQSISKINISS